jgi:hypothetical protein
MNRKLTDRMRERAITELLKAKSLDAAARKLGISSKTLSRWLAEPEFRAAYAHAKAEILKMASAVLTRNSAKAAQVLCEIFSSKKGKANQSARVSAAIGNIRLAHESFELESLEERVRQLEEQRHEAL